MTYPTLPSRVLVFLFLCSCDGSLWAQSQATGLQNPKTLSMDPTTAHAFVVEQDSDKLIRWDGKEIDVLFEGLSNEPANIKEIVGSTFRDGNRLSLVGTSTSAPEGEKTIRLVTLKIDVEDPTKFDLGLSQDLSLEGVDSVTAIASTDYAIYLATTSKSARQVWRIESRRRTTLEKPSPIFESSTGVISALAVSPQGHLLAAIGKHKLGSADSDDVDDEPHSSCVLEFLHAETGKKLLTVPTDVNAVTSLSYSPKSGLLYASGTQGDRQGVYRLDVFFNGRQQSVRAHEIAQIDDVFKFVLSTQNAVALVGGKTDGRAVHIEVK